MKILLVIRWGLRGLSAPRMLKAFLAVSPPPEGPISPLTPHTNVLAFV
ncbi:MAG: hypothetical protein J5835_03980 [Bacteroidales bacterium]|nr:hypothetical protein [Bacteroidales bacterium]